MKYFALVLSFLCYIVGTLSTLSISGQKCGVSTYCKISEYCSDFDNLCQPCSSICDENHHNLDAIKCEKDCQNYLHDVRFGASQSSYTDSDLRMEVRHLRYMITITLTLTCLTLACIGTFLIILFIRWKNKHHLTVEWIRKKLNTQKKSEKHVPTVAVTNTSGKPDLRLDMPPLPLLTASTAAGGSPSTATTTLSRRPTEDSTLDYAYDNPAMAGSPSPNAKPHESSL